MKALIDQIMQSASLPETGGYSDPRKNLVVATPPVLPEALDAENIVLRLFYGWMVLRIQTLCDLSQYSRRTIERAVYALLKKGQISKLGRAPVESYASSNEDLYTLGPKLPKQHPYGFRTTLDCQPWSPDYHEASGLVTGKKIIVPAHPYYVSEAAAWFAATTARLGFPCLAIPEQVLRREYGWCSLKKKQPKSYFITPVPDAWLLYGGCRMRLEVQVSKTSPNKVRDICESSPLKEPVLYVVKDEEMYRSLSPLLDEFSHFFLVRMWSEEDMAKIPARYQCLVDIGGLHPWWMADYYSAPVFVRSVMDAEDADLFERNWPRRVAAASPA